MLSTANHLGNAIQNHNEMSSHTFHNGYHQKRAQITNAGKNVEKRKPLCIISGSVNWCSHCGNSKEVYQNKTRATILPSNSTPRYIYKKQLQQNPQTNSNLKTYMHPSICSIIFSFYNCQDTAST